MWHEISEEINWSYYIHDDYFENYYKSILENNKSESLYKLESIDYDINDV